MGTLLRVVRENRGIIALLLFTLAVRGGLMIAQFRQLENDPDLYYLMASNIVRFAAFSREDPTNVGSNTSEMRPSAFRPPLYPIVLSNLAVGKDKIIHFESIALVHLGLGLATVWLTWRIAQSLQLGWGSYLAGVLVACDPILLAYQPQVMTETLAAFCAVLAWGLLVRFHFDRNWWNAGLAGGAIGLAALCRPTFLPWLAVIPFIVLWMQPGKPADRESATDREPRWNLRVLNCVALLIGGLGVMFPWAWRNYREFKSPLLTTTHGGYTLYLANNRHFYRYVREDDSGLPWEPKQELVWTDGGLQYTQSFRAERRSELYDKKDAPFSRSTPNNELAIDNYQTNLAQEAMRADPVGFVLAALYRVRQLWTPLAYRTEANESLSRTLLRYVSAAWYCAVYGLALAGLLQLRGNVLRSPWVFGVALCCTFTAVHTLYWCNLRMRAPLMPIVAVVAGVGAVELTKQIGSHHSALPRNTNSKIVSAISNTIRPTI